MADLAPTPDSLINLLANPPSPFAQFGGPGGYMGFMAKQAQGGAAAQAIDPDTGQFDQGKYNALLSQNRWGRYGLPEAVQQSGQSSEAQLRAETQGETLQQQQMATVSARLNGLANINTPLQRQAMESYSDPTKPFVTGQQAMDGLNQAKAAGYFKGPEGQAEYDALHEQIDQIGPTGNANNLITGIGAALQEGSQRATSLQGEPTTIQRGFGTQVIQPVPGTAQPPSGVYGTTLSVEQGSKPIDLDNGYGVKKTYFVAEALGKLASDPKFAAANPGFAAWAKYVTGSGGVAPPPGSGIMGAPPAPPAPQGATGTPVTPQNYGMATGALPGGTPAPETPAPPAPPGPGETQTPPGRYPGGTAAPAAPASHTWAVPPPPPPQGFGGFREGMATGSDKLVQNSVDNATSLGHQTQRVGDTAPILADMETQLQGGPISGVGTNTVSALRQLVINLGIPGVSDSVNLADNEARQNEFNKDVALLLQYQMSAMGMNQSDARQEMLAAGVPSGQLSKEGNLRIVHMLQGNNQALTAINNAWGEAQAKGWIPQRYNDWVNQYFYAAKDQNGGKFDRRAFWFANMSPAEQYDYYHKMDSDPTLQKQFLANVKYAQGEGWVGSGANGQAAPVSP